MNRYIFHSLLVLGLLSTISLKAQVNNWTSYSSHFGTHSSYNLPSRLGEDFDKVSVSLFEVYGWLGNNSITLGELADFNKERDANKFVENFDESNVFGAGATAKLMDVAFKISKDKVELFTLGFGLRGFGAISTRFGKNAISLAANGNHQWLGQTVNLGEIEANGLGFMEYSLAASLPIPYDFNGKFEVRSGIRLKYLTGILGVHTDHMDMLMHTKPDGSEIEFELDYLLHRSDASTQDGLGNAPGTGIGIDWGATVTIAENMSASISVLDIGGVTFNDQSTSYKRASTVTYEGFEVNIFDIDTDNLWNLRFDEFSEFTDPIETKEKFTMSLPTRLIAQFEYRLIEKVSKKGTEFFNHNFFFTYVQGFNRMPANATRPLLQAAYMYNVGNVWNIGGNVGFGGYNVFNLGLFTSVRAGFFNFGLGSNNLTGFLLPSAAQGLDLSVNMGLTF